MIYGASTTLEAESYSLKQTGSSQRPKKYRGWVRAIGIMGAHEHLVLTVQPIALLVHIIDTELNTTFGTH